MPAKILILNGNTKAGNDRIVALGGAPYGEGYADALRFFEPDLDITILMAADGEALPAGVGLSDFDGVAWTGSALSAYENRIEVSRQIELARAVHAARLPCFGSCWGQQIMCQALGGQVRANPKGTEIGIARDIERSGAAENHAMFAGKALVFDALAIHRDEVVTLPQGARVLASNAMSSVQAMELAGSHGNFWGVQYHPEFDLQLMGVLFARDRAVLLEQKLYPDGDAVSRAIADFAALNEDPGQASLAERHGLDQNILDPACRMAELGNWLRSQALPRGST
ncbi:MAG: type 1 glutamine amidotransferase [Hyphomicrobiales bacterium]|nr:type 1 glutamine amidotransferase [Hyphomicrobiales bacterium]